MNEFLNKILTGVGIDAPEVCKEAFNQHFSNAINPEWNFGQDIYEVLFQKEGIEFIANFNSTGNLIKYKMYLDKELLPTLIKTNLEIDREIMNAVLINEGNEIIYEIIVRNSALERFLVVVDQLGKVLKERML